MRGCPVDVGENNDVPIIIILLFQILAFGLLIKVPFLVLLIIVTSTPPEYVLNPLLFQEGGGCTLSCGGKGTCWAISERGACSKQVTSWGGGSRAGLMA